MLKQFSIYFVLSFLIVLFAGYAHLLIIYIDLAYTYINFKLAPLFHHVSSGGQIRNVISLVLLPLILVGIPALIYQLIKKRQMPYFIEIIWLLWLVLVLSQVLIH
jgi:hypothetical protein